MSHNHDFAKFSPPPPSDFAPNWWEEQDIPVADEWGIPYEQDLDFGLSEHGPPPLLAPSGARRGGLMSPDPAPTQIAPTPPSLAPSGANEGGGQHGSENPLEATAAMCPSPAPCCPDKPDKPTMAEYLASLDKWPLWDGVPVQPRPVPTSSQLRAMLKRTNERRIELSDSEWASNVLTFRQIQNTAFEGRCGTGKSTLATGHKEHSITIVPTTPIVEQLASSECQVIKAGVKPDFEKYQQFGSTYDSFPRLCQEALEAGYNPYLVPLVLDEAQHMLSDGFKRRRLDACMDEVRKFKHVTPMSATMPPILPYLEHLPRLVLERPSQPVKWSYVIGSEVAMTKRCLEQGQIVLLHINNKNKIQLEKSHFESQGYQVEYIDSDNKDEMMERGLSDKRLPDADIYLCTSVFNDGISVHEHAKEYVVILSEESLRHLGPNEIIQVAQRLRDYMPSHVYLMRSTDEFDEERAMLEEDYINEYIRIVEQNEIIAAGMTAMYHNFKQSQTSETLISWENHQSAWERMYPMRDDAFIQFNKEREIYEVNLRAIGEFVYSTLQKVCHKSCVMMGYWLGLHGFSFSGIIVIEKETELEKDLLKTSKNRTKAERKTQRDTIAQFDTYQDAYEASKADIPTTYHEAAKELPFEEFVKGREGEDREVLRQEHRQVLKEKVKSADIKRDAAKIYVEHVQTLCDNGVKFQDAVIEAKKDLALSTLTCEALRILKLKSLAEGLARDERNPSVAKVDDIAAVSEILEYMRGQLGKPLDKDATNAVIDHALRHSQAPKGLRYRLTIPPRFPRNKPTGREPTPKLLRHALMLAKRRTRKKMTKKAAAEEKERLSLLSDKELYEHIERAHKEVRAKAIEEAATSTWKKRKEFLNHFFEMRRGKVEIDGNRVNVWIPIKELHAE